MERAAILGVYDYIGYSLCKYMLDLGIEIEGIDITNSDDDYFTDEKRMEIGRNANFSEVAFKAWDTSEIGEYIFISLFEHTKKQRQGRKFIKSLMQKLEGWKPSGSKVILLLPAYLALENEVLDEGLQELQRFLKKENTIPVLEFYLPTIYGPWQPEDFFFQQVMNHLDRGGSIPEAADWEWTDDAIYIDDTVQTIMELSGSNAEGKYYLSSGKKNQWAECAEELLGKQNSPSRWKTGKQIAVKENIKVWTLNKNEEISTGLLKQKEQYNRIQESRV